MFFLFGFTTPADIEGGDSSLSPIISRTSATKIKKKHEKKEEARQNKRDEARRDRDRDEFNTQGTRRGHTTGQGDSNSTSYHPLGRMKDAA